MNDLVISVFSLESKRLLRNLRVVHCVRGHRHPKAVSSMPAHVKLVEHKQQQKKLLKDI